MFGEACQYTYRKKKRAELAKRRAEKQKKAAEAQSGEGAAPVIVGGKSREELSTPSIRKVLSGETSYVKKKTNSKEEEIPTGGSSSFGNDKIDNARLAKAWRVVADEFKNKPSIRGFILNNSPKLVNETHIAIPASSETLLETLEKERNRILYYMKKQLNNSGIELHFSLSELENVVSLTDADRVKLLMKKHPVFDRLRREFDLEIE